jgi:hypothetical protein
MTRNLPHRIVAPFRRLGGLHWQRFNGLTACLLLVLSAAAFPPAIRAQTGLPEPIAARSVSGQFIVTGAPPAPAGSGLAARPEIATNANFVRLEPALLVVSAERIKESLEHNLNPELPVLPPPSSPPGKIFLALHPAQSTEEGVTIVSRSFPAGWDYQVRLPDVLPRIRYLRAMTGVLLLELANRDGHERSAEVPAWLVDGLSQELLATAGPEIILTMPNKTANGPPLSRTVATTRGLDSLAGARRVLRDQSALTFEQLSWPTDVQLSGRDGGVYRASAQLFVNELLSLKDGPTRLRTMLGSLPKYYNWQVAFQTAFRENFPRPLDVEKWWAVQVVGFIARDPGPAWTPAVSRDRLDEILSVAVEMRTASNALPAHAEVSVQAVIRNFDRKRQGEILQPKLNALQLAELRMSPAFAVLADEYRRTIADYLEPAARAVSRPNLGEHPPLVLSRPSVAGTLKKLDALDARRRAVESAANPDGK